MKKLALVMSLFLGAVTFSYAQDAQTPRFAQPRNEAEKPVIAKAVSETDEMKKMLKLDDKQALTLLEINVGIERKTAAASGDQATINELENRRWEFYSRYLTQKQLDKYKKYKNKQ